MVTHLRQVMRHGPKRTWKLIDSENVGLDSIWSHFKLLSKFLLGLPFVDGFNHEPTKHVDMRPDNDVTTAVSNKEFYSLLLIQTYVCFVSNGLFPSIATYSSLPYGNTVYHLSAAMHAMANPVSVKLHVEDLFCSVRAY